ncbi:hypothetical protein C4G66_RS13630 [Vibrio parahaemolyticus]|uniref:hypothetical protein n=1 Tax=Vibrio parahaemolyticus TaxID=670 RepID=UPI0004DF0933|nr:hypothetical protein [Vibrio parahaemolyticus]EJG0987964.1 hypothetical protein [Vibrio parahaemolyticus]EJG1069435.1 hypothetical protein [Vibrio parahaemolyticus]HCG9738611.1 hypothetical protein [Vibrio parahaemolyticus]
MNYLNFIGCTYQDLVKNPKFAALITGNVPSTMDGYTEEFYIRTFDNGLEFQFDANSSVLKLIVATNPNFFMDDLKNISSKELVHQMMGKPVESMLEKKVPVLGVVGAWDKYKSANGHTIQVLYEVGSTKIKSVFYR